MISMDKQYTSGGKPVRLLCTDGPGSYPVLGFVGDSDFVTKWLPDGSTDMIAHPLVEVVPRVRVEMWVNILKWEGSDSPVFTDFRLSREDADAADYGPGYVVLARAVKFEWEGEDQ